MNNITMSIFVIKSFIKRIKINYADLKNDF